MKKVYKSITGLTTLLIGFAQWSLADNNVPTQFSNQGGIVNSRHNMSQSTEQSNSGGTMNSYRNRYGEVCVYCHTPHGASTTAAVPLWNRTLPPTTYTTYNQLNTSSLTQEVSQPGAASLPCLSCHDGTQAVDAIINMPGSRQYSTSANPGAWNPVAAGYSSNYKSAQHRGLAVTQVGSGQPIAGLGCLACHNNDPDGIGGGVADDFSIALIGRDLRNDHPVGVNFPANSGPDTEWNTPDGVIVKNGVTSRFFDETPDGYMDKAEIRLYGTGGDFRVECASCHDPHGVPRGGVPGNGGSGNTFSPTFLRKINDNSAVCLTCHNK